MNNDCFKDINETAESVAKEIRSGLELLSTIEKPVVTFYGSHKPDPGSEYYVHAEKTAYALGKLGYTIITGGGSGIMHAANSGAKRAGALSVGMKLDLLKHEWSADPIYTDVRSFRFMFARRFAMSIKAEAMIYYPGGLGTMNELFENAALMANDVVDRAPMICAFTEYWKNLFAWLKKNPLEQNFYVNGATDLNLISFADTPDEIIRAISTGVIK